MKSSVESQSFDFDSSGSGMHTLGGRVGDIPLFCVCYLWQECVFVEVKCGLGKY